jgi:hypothetical protein
MFRWMIIHHGETAEFAIVLDVVAVAVAPDIKVADNIWDGVERGDAVAKKLLSWSGVNIVAVR